MKASPEEIETLYEVQQSYLDVSSLNRQLEDLPQRKTILDARTRKGAINAQRDKVSALRKDAAKRLTRINDEDASLQKKESGVQAAIEAAGNDYRNAEARTKELDGIFRRREELARSRTEVEAELEKIKALDAQAEEALGELDAVETEAVASFKAEGTALMGRIAEAKARGDQLLAQLSPEVADFFNKTAALFDTVAIARLEGGSCSVCRTRIEPGRLLDLRQQAPLSHCPSCKRILVIEEQS